MRPRNPIAIAGRFIARRLLKGALDFDQKEFEEYIERMGREYNGHMEVTFVVFDEAGDD